MNYSVIYLVVFVAVWVIYTNLFFRHFQKEWPRIAKDCYWEDIWTGAVFGFVVALLWPITLPGTLIGLIVYKINKKV